jgi:hypothetical protein
MLVSVSDLSKYMDIRFSNRQEEAAEFVLEGLQSELESYLRRPIEPTVFEETYVLESNHTGVPMSSFFTNESSSSTDTVSMVSYMQPPQTVYLRNSPVIEVEEVTLRQQGSATASTLTDGIDYVVRRYGIDIFRGFANDVITVSYTAGLAGEGIKVFKLMLLRAATREMQNMHDDVVGIKDLETRNVAPLETGFLEKELLAVKRWRRSRVA